MRRIAVAFAAAGMGCAGLSGCSFQIGGGPPTVAQDDLQNDISERLANAGEKPESVTCDGPLVGEVGKTTRCDVVLSATNKFQPVVTVTKVEDTTVSYEVTPAMSKEQLEEFISARDSDEGKQVESVSCDSGLDGEQGAITYCDTEAPKGTFRKKVEVVEVDGLLMHFNFAPVYTKRDIATGLLDILEERFGERPDSATCDDDMIGEEGTSVDCTVSMGPDEQVFTLTVTGVDGESIDFNYEARN